MKKVKRPNYNIFHDAYRLPYDEMSRVKIYRSSKGNLDLVQRLGLLHKLPVHNDCVNTICWNETGEYILSGSDDQRLVITNGFNYKVATDYKTSHRANIFSAKFLPCRGDTSIVSCSGDGIILYTDLMRPDKTRFSQFNCHTGTTYEVATVPLDPNSFLSCGEDGTVRWFDIRRKERCRRLNCTEDVIVACQRPVTALAVNATLPYQLAVGCSDSIVRLYDRRMLVTKATVKQTNAALCFPTLTVPSFEDRSYRITSLCFSPEGDDILVSYSSDHLYLFNIKEQSSMQLKANGSGEAVETPRRVSSDAQLKKSLPLPVRRLRLRGDWSDTGPNARPAREGGRRGEVAQARPTLRTTLMQRMTFVLSRMLNDPATRAALSGGGEDSLQSGAPQRQPADGAAAQPDQDQDREPEQEPEPEPESEHGTEAEAAAAAAAATGSGAEPPPSAERRRPRSKRSARRRNSTNSSPTGPEPGSAKRTLFGDAEANASGAVDMGATSSGAATSAHFSSTSNADKLGQRGAESKGPCSGRRRLSSANASAEEFDMLATTDNEEDEEDDDIGAGSPPRPRAPAGLVDENRAVGREADENQHQASPSANSRESIYDASTEEYVTDTEDDYVSDSDDQEIGRRFIAGSDEESRDVIDSDSEGALSGGSSMIKQKYTGHRNARTMIKEATFWGTEFVMSGSDCGHVFIWERVGGRLVMLLQADEHVVNCLQPHPHEPLLASSGIDHDIKLWAPMGEDSQFDETLADELTKRNALMLEETRDTVTVPASFMIRMLACLHQIRRGGRGPSRRQRSHGSDDD